MSKVAKKQKINDFLAKNKSLKVPQFIAENLDAQNIQGCPYSGREIQKIKYAPITSVYEERRSFS